MSRPAPARRVARLPDAEPLVEAAPSGSVTAEPLAPLPGTAPAPVTAGSGTVLADLPPASAPTPVESIAPQGAPASSAAGSRSAAIGGWTARDATGASCRVSLSSSPALDLYRASAGGCANRDLSRVTAWDYRDGEVYLYQPGGAVAARLRSEGGSLNGVLAKSGAPLTLTR